MKVGLRILSYPRAFSPSIPPLGPSVPSFFSYYSGTNLVLSSTLQTRPPAAKSSSRRIFYDKRISQEVEADALGDEWKGYVLKITGGNDKQGFPMMQGVLSNQRVRLLLGKEHKCFRARRTGERKRKSIRGCIVGPDLSALALVITKTGETALPGLTDTTVPRRLGPKRASKIRKLFNLGKEDDVRKYVIRREVPSKKEGQKPKSKAPKIQRLVTPVVLQRKRARMALKIAKLEASKQAASEYAELLAARKQEMKGKRVAKRRSVSH